MYEAGIGGEKFAQVGFVTDGGGFKDVEGDSVAGEAGEEEVADEGLRAVDGPEECGDALRVAPGGEGGVGLNGVCDFSGCAGLDEFEEGGTHGLKIARPGESRPVECGIIPAGQRYAG